MRLGRLLIRGFGKRLRKPAKKLAKGAKTASRKPAKRLKKQAFRAPPAPTTTRAVQVRTVIVEREPEPAPSQTKELSVATLLRDGEFQRSIEAFLLDQRSPHTRRAYGKDLKRFFGYLLVRREAGDVRVDRSAIIAYKESLIAEGFEHTSVDRHLATLRSFFRWLVDDGRIEKSPADGVRFLNPKRISRTLGFSDEEVQKVLRIPNVHTRTGALHYAVLMVLFHCGLRRSELCALRTSNLGKERGHRVIRVRGKGDAERLIAVTEPVGLAIDHYMRINRRDLRLDQPLFAPVRNNRGGTRDKGLDSSMIYYIVTTYAREAGVANRVSPHSCRATAISNARDHGVADRAIQEFAGWTSPQMITHYDKRRTAAEDSAARSIRYGAEDRVKLISSWSGGAGGETAEGRGPSLSGQASGQARTRAPGDLPEDPQ